MRSWNRGSGAGKLGALILAIGSLSQPLAAQAGDDGTVEEIVAILKDKGLIDAAQENQLLARHQAEKAKAAPSVGAKIMEGVEWSGDFRLRHETFWFDRNPNSITESDNRYRLRYRARLGFAKKVNDWAKVGVRLASGTFENDSTNRTAGTEILPTTVGAGGGTVRGFDEDFDFGPDSIFIDRAWAEFNLPTGEIATKLVAGKVGNPFIWKNGKDILIWDGDINPEGVYLTTSFELNDSASLFATVGGFDVDENSSSADGMLYAGQFGSHFKLGGSASAGIRGTLYQWRNLDGDNQTRAGSDGNTILQTFDVDGNGLADAKIGEVSAYLNAGGGDWPMTFYGTFAKNFDAQSLGPIHKDDNAYSFGFELGDKKKLVKLGIGYFYAETNSLIANFIDSDVLDSKTNRKGFAFYGSRELGDNVDLNLTLFDSKEINDGAGSGTNSLSGADRRRLQSDVVVKF